MEAFKIKNGLSAKRYLGSTTTLSGSTIDLSLGSMFSTTLSSDPAYTFTNPPASGNAQAFSVEVTGGTTNFVNDSFATTLYDGNATARSISNGLDLSGDGGLVWIKSRTASSNHGLFDSEVGTGSYLITNGTNASEPLSNYLQFNSDGFQFNSGTGYLFTNNSSHTYVSWAFKKQTKFFDVVTYSGDGTTDRQISHSLGSSPAVIIVKTTNVTDNWLVYHKDLTQQSFAGNVYTHSLSLNATAAESQTVSFRDNAQQTSSVFTLGYTGSNTNEVGKDYVAYLFAHDTASDSRIKCGSYTGNGSTTGDFEDLGWQPQWIMVKVSSSTDGWILLDSVRGVTGGNDPRLEANTSGSEANGQIMEFSSTGFTPLTADGKINGSGKTYIYMAIRGDAATDSAITWPSSVKWPSGVAPTTPAAGTKDLFTFLTTDGGTTYYGKKAAEGLA